MGANDKGPEWACVRTPHPRRGHPVCAKFGTRNIPIASSGWLEKSKLRHGIAERTLSGESNTVSEGDCSAWTTQVLPGILAEYEAEHVYNMDETGLFFKCLPNKTLTFKNDKCFGGKQSEERVTVVLCANMTGTDKLKPLVIGESKKPRCFKGVKSLEVDYEANTKAWMTGVSKMAT